MCSRQPLCPPRILALSLCLMLLPGFRGGDAQASGLGVNSASSAEAQASADKGAAAPVARRTTSKAKVRTATMQTLYAEPGAGFGFAYTLVSQAKKTIDMTMYELVDTTFSGDLVAACKRGVKVRVILDQNLEKNSNTAAYNQLNAQVNCAAAWANPAFQATHEKSIVIDGTTLVMLTANLTTRYYSTSRDFAMVEKDAADVAAVEATLNADYRSTSDYKYTPAPGDDLIWSPTTAQADLLGIINGAAKTLLVENEEMGAVNIVSALEAACRRGVAVQITMTDQTKYETNFAALQAAGCGVHIYANTSSALYIHAKVLLADFGLATQKVYLGSINFSIPSMTENRELGMYVANAAIVKQLQTTLTADYAGAPTFKAAGHPAN
jgi:cardiolipin synthase